MIFFILFWLLLIGGAVGSFLNVVIYRLPAGLSLLSPPSHCPKCTHPIRPRDNVPVFGWFLLCGKCRDCQAPISIRYPFVEGLCTLLFVTVGYAVLVNRPIDELEQSLGRIVCDLLLLTTLLVAGMIDYDGKKVPVELFVPAFFGALIALAISWNNAIIPSFDFVGLLLFLLLLFALFPAIPLRLPQNSVPGLIAVVIISLYLGWKFTWGILLYLLLFWIAHCCFRIRFLPMLHLFLLVWVIIVGMNLRIDPIQQTVFIPTGFSNMLSNALHYLHPQF